MSETGIPKEVIRPPTSDTPSPREIVKTGEVAAKGLKPVSSLLRELPDHFLNSRVTDYAQALENFETRGLKVLKPGGESVAIELEDETVLKVQGTPLHPEFGHRPFDCPVVRIGEPVVIYHNIPNVDPTEVHWYVQPKVDTEVTFEETKAFIKELENQGYRDVDIGYEGQKQLGKLNGRLVLIDYTAVSPLRPS